MKFHLVTATTYFSGIVQFGCTQGFSTFQEVLEAISITQSGRELWDNDGFTRTVHYRISCEGTAEDKMYRFGFDDKSRTFLYVDEYMVPALAAV